MFTKFQATAIAALVGVALTFAGAAKATNLVMDGSFDQLSGGIGQIGYNGTSLTGWTNGHDGSGNLGYTFVYSSGSADTTGANGVSGNVKLWGPNDGSANGLPATSPDGGNYIASDGAYQTAPLSQTINGLTSGAQYTVSFWFAGAQQSGYRGTNTEQWLVSLGGQQLATNILKNTDEGFTGWQYTTLTFTATSSSEVLSFLAAGTPSGVPPFSLLDGISMSQVVSTPEPGSIAMLLTGLGAIGVIARRRQMVRARAA
ncbi:MAG TPA: PEP-CTERM sorting domain-containing protein [Alphaproteobacteria bacterium]|jgi:hypothetical protein|nr:PEP-CTERM sorting domain-containing protein [Alphaproteobacteria bacterium]